MGHRDRLRPAVYLKLRKDALEVRGDGLRADDELGGDFRLRPPLSKHPQDLLFARGEPVSHRILIGYE